MVGAEVVEPLEEEAMTSDMTLLDFVRARERKEGYIDTKRDGDQTYYRWRNYVLDPTTGKKKRGDSFYLGNDNTRKYRERTS